MSLSKINWKAKRKKGKDAKVFEKYKEKRMYDILHKNKKTTQTDLEQAMSFLLTKEEVDIFYEEMVPQSKLKRHSSMKMQSDK